MLMLSLTVLLEDQPDNGGIDHVTLCEWKDQELECQNEMVLNVDSAICSIGNI